jgi:hypothetical protein
MTTYYVEVRNVGTTLETTDRAEALSEYAAYVAISKMPFGRAAGEPVVLMTDDDILLEYQPEETQPLTGECFIQRVLQRRRRITLKPKQ